jgi:hypothetical protein
MNAVRAMWIVAALIWSGIGAVIMYGNALVANHVR